MTTIDNEVTTNNMEGQTIDEMSKQNGLEDIESCVLAEQVEVDGSVEPVG